MLLLQLIASTGSVGYIDLILRRIRTDSAPIPIKSSTITVGRMILIIASKRLSHLATNTTLKPSASRESFNTSLMDSSASWIRIFFMILTFFGIRSNKHRLTGDSFLIHPGIHLHKSGPLRMSFSAFTGGAKNN